VLEALDIHVDTRRCLQRLCRWVAAVSGKEATVSEINALQQELPEILCQLEILLPVRFNTISLHVHHHFCKSYHDHGPPHCGSM